jgi:diguanylate cyclase (GGDEF)-like protein
MRTRTELVELVRQNRRLDELASVDVLTDLPNRRRLDEQLRHLESFATRRSEPLGVLIVDVDHFKSVNDSRGHHAGDDVLREVAARLRRGLRTEDSVGRTSTLGRWAGDEFILGFAGVSEPGLATIAERLRTIIADEPIVTADGERLTVTISIGGSSALSEPWPQLLRRADNALYSVKEAGRNASRIIAGDKDALTLPKADRWTEVH